MYIHKYQEKELHKEQKLKILFIFPLTFMILGILFSYLDNESNLTLYFWIKKYYTFTYNINYRFSLCWWNRFYIC